MDGGNLVLSLPLSSLLDEYDKKVENIDQEIEAYENAISALKFASSVRGSYGNNAVGYVSVPRKDELLRCLRISAWRYLYQDRNMSVLMTAAERVKFERDLENPPEFTLETIKATFGDRLLNPRQVLLRGLAEAFCSLDDAYKSHSKVKIGVKGLPKRVILSNWDSWGSYGRDRAVDLINALRLVQGKGRIDFTDLKWNVNGCSENNRIRDYSKTKENPEGVPHVKLEGLSFRSFQNGNLHIMFDKDNLTDINRALAEYYGEVLPDVEDDSDEPPILRGTAVAKDLQFYPSPKETVWKLVNDIHFKDEKILEPSCGDGRIMDVVREVCEADGISCQMFGYEVHPGRAEQARAKGHAVVTANFLEIPPCPEFDLVLMNPPFYGQHYLKHINHAIKFLKPGGRLRSILPATAWYDHGLLPKQELRSWESVWFDLPVGSFAECGTNVPTGIWRYIKPSD